MKSLLLALIILLPGGLASAEYNSKFLKTKDYEEMRKLLHGYISRSQDKAGAGGEDADSAISELKRGLKTLLMRPDTDSIRSSLMIILQNEIIKYRSFMGVFQELVEEALKEFKSGKGSVVYQTSLLYLIENSLSYLQSINNKESTLILQKIKKAKLKIPKKVFNYLLLEMGRGKTADPSFLAGRILKERYKELKKAKAEKARREKEKQKAEEKKKKAKPAKSAEDKKDSSAVKSKKTK